MRKICLIIHCRETDSRVAGICMSYISVHARAALDFGKHVVLFKYYRSNKKLGHIIHLSGPRCFPDFGSAVRTVKFTCDVHMGDSCHRFCFPTVLLTLWEP